ncbi:MAG: cell division protein FtsL [Pseudomonadota bacterium]
MQSPVYVCAVALVVAVATWAYAVNYETRAAEKRVHVLQDSIAAEREAIGVLDVEWVYLNRPERIEHLVGIHAAQLGLMPLDPAHYAPLGLVAYPRADHNVPPLALQVRGRSDALLPMTLPDAMELMRVSGEAQ